MVDIEKQIQYWYEGATEDWEVAQDLMSMGHTRHGLFFVHLTLEKILKAHVCLQTKDLAPRIHNLVRLADLTELDLDPGQRKLLAEINIFNLQGRYPDTLFPEPSPEDVEQYVIQAGAMYRWLKKQLPIS